MALSLFAARDVAASGPFSSRLAAALASAAGNVYSESWLVNTIQQANSGTRVLTVSLGSIPGWVTPGTAITDLDLVAVIPSGTVVAGTGSSGSGSTITLSTALSGTLSNGATISFPAHKIRAAFANQIANSNYNLLAIGLIALSNLALAAEGTDDGSQLNSIPDTDLQFAVNSFYSLFAGA